MALRSFTLLDLISSASPGRELTPRPGCYLLCRDDAQLIGVGDVNRRGERAGVLRRWAGIGHRAGVPVAAVEELNLDIGRHLSAGGRCQIEADRFDRRWVRGTK